MKAGIIMCLRLYDTALWKTYQSKKPSSSRVQWIEGVYNTAIKWLKEIPATFPNYTLHDEDHVINVMRAIAGILGSKITLLSAGECELLILASVFHDIGMVYDAQGKKKAVENPKKCREFLLKNAPDYIGSAFEEWPENKQQDYLRTLHPYRLPELFADKQWNFSNRPREIVHPNILIAVCQSHGEDESFLKNNRNLAFQTTNDVDPRFCALLLRLGDILDFDGTRAPEILFSFAEGKPRSEEAFRKHLASNGFVYPEEPSDRELPYSAECSEPWVEHKIRDYLNWVDHEFVVCNDLKKLCNKDWQRQFSFPRSVSRNQINRIGYDSDDFSLTMDQEQILTLLTGKNLYSSNDIFVRELLQNAIDATLLRKQMDPYFDLASDDAAIYLWEGLDQNGDLIFRIDDQGTGMTRGMLRRYFLKVGNSYYNSTELKRDLRKHSCNTSYYANSRFGIGFLSCFLCATQAEISTLYFDDYKSQEDYEPDAMNSGGFGLRMDISGLRGYYTLRNQALDHIVDIPLPYPREFEDTLPFSFENGGYRYKPGTSIVVKLDPGKLGNCNIRDSVQDFICGTPMPVYFNGQRLGRTYLEIIKEARALEGEYSYELTDEEKQKYDSTFPNAKGNYPQIIVTTTVIDEPNYQILPGLSGVVTKYRVSYKSPPKWTIMDQVYTVNIRFSVDYEDDKRVLILGCENIKESSSFYTNSWERLERIYGSEAVDALSEKFKQYSSCPTDCAALGEAWNPFAEKLDITDVWRSFVDKDHTKNMIALFDLESVPLLYRITKNKKCRNGTCTYQAVICGKVDEEYGGCEYDALFYLEGNLRPSVDVGRTHITHLSTEANLAICGIMISLECEDFRVRSDISVSNELLPKWREIRKSKLGKWLVKTLEPRGNKLLVELEKPLCKGSRFSISNRYHSDVASIYCFFMALLQDEYQIAISYEKGQILVLTRKGSEDSDEAYDPFPPMMFCNAASDESRKFLCCSERVYRRGITADHPFGKWLIKNAVVLNKYFPHQFRQINDCLRNSDADEIIRVVNGISGQLSQLSKVHGINISSLPSLAKTDFWEPPIKSS